MENRTNNPPVGEEAIAEHEFETLESLQSVQAELDALEGVEPSEKPAEPEQPKEQSAGKLVFRLTLSLFVICAAVALLLAGVNAITKDKIEEYAAEKRADAMAEVLPDTISASYGDSAELESGARVTPVTDSFWSYADPDGAPHYLCVETWPKGYGGEISLMVGVKIGERAEGGGYPLTVCGVRIVSHSETGTVGGRADDPEFLGQYEGLTGGITIGSGENSITAVSGATITSKAITAGVNDALAAADEYLREVTDIG